MVSLTITQFQFCIPHKPISYLSVLSTYPVLKPNTRVTITRKKASDLCGFSGKRSDISGFLQLGKAKFRENSWCCWCKQSWESEGDSELEAEILEFMEKSAKPGAFPSKKELVEAGRMDLVEAIKNRGGWFSMGWESEEEEANEGGNFAEGEESKLDFDLEDFQRRVECVRETASSKETDHGDSPPSPDAMNSPFSAQPASSSGRSLENEFEEDSGIDGILSRLEKERNSSFGINMSVHRGYPSSQDSGNGKHPGTSAYVGRSKEDGNTGHYTKPDKINNGDGKHSQYTKPDSWRNWSLSRADFKDIEFEAGEICFGNNQMQNQEEISIRENDAASTEALHKWNLNSDPIEIRLQDLQQELSSALHSLKSGNEEINTVNVLGNSRDDFQSLSDALEFQQNEFMSSQENLRSIRAKLAVLEGKMALAILDAQKILEEKQLRIDGARRSLELLRSAYIVWPNSASEVLVAGSFDGWTTQRKMRKSETGIFSLCLMLYPGRYEIKFIVDGKWRVDPLRPIVFSNGYENNLLIVPEKPSQNSNY
ncbi:OLC1v1028065C1 [Oldenlandia corymbosa var. corymbosa]|uniref:OLC1v1028065C1 n=1 Tax=Oldenlandia corymbosa var. corymbosa TaxID=529605 RepID=A0AAV1CAW4_OLDCO|nr:OLC1v1028065C1 [Oldenlandia corymbosa var. corymbosa]